MSAIAYVRPHMRNATRLLAAGLFALCAPLLADFSGTVVGVSDGDTVTVRTNDGRTIKVRLNGIDCPEKGQAFGSRAKEFTSYYVFGKNVTIREHGLDRYGRTIGDVVLEDGRILNTELVRSGLAWQYKKYSKDPELARLEAEAKASRIGLWVDPKPVPPWEYRHEENGDVKKEPEQKAEKPQPKRLTISNDNLYVSSGGRLLGGGFGASSPSGSEGGSSSGSKTGDGPSSSASKTQHVSGYTTRSGHSVGSYSRSSAGSGGSKTK